MPDGSVTVSVARSRSRIEALRTFAAQSPANQRLSEALLSGLGNAYKSDAGRAGTHTTSL